METTFASLSFDIPEFKKSKEEAVAILREMQANIDKFNANGDALLHIGSNSELKANRQEAAALSAELEKLKTRYNEVRKTLNDIVITQQQAGAALSKTNEAAAGSAGKARTEYEKLNDEFNETIALMRELGRTKGIDSIQYKEAAQQAANLKQQIKDINALPKPNIGTQATAKPAAPAPAIISTDNLAQLEAEQQAAEKTGVAVSDLEAQEAAGISSAQEWYKAQIQAAKAVGEGAAATEEAVAATEQLGAANEAVGASVTQAAGAYAGFNTELQQNIAVLVENDLALKQNKAAQADLQKTILQAGGATDVQVRELTKLREEEILLTQANRDLNTTVQAGIRYETAAAGSADQLKANLVLLTQQYKQLTAAEKASADGLKIKGDLVDTAKALTEAEGAAKKTTGAVGALSKGFGFLRTAAAILPGIGIAGIFNLAFEGIGDLISNLEIFKDKLTDAKVAQQAFSEVEKQAGYVYGKAKVEVDGLQEKIKLVNEGFLDSKEVLKEYNAGIGETIGKATSLAAAEQALIDKAPDYIKFTFLKAQATAAADLAAKEASKSIELQAKHTKEFANGMEKFLGGLSAFFTNGSIKSAVDEYNSDLSRVGQVEQGKQLENSSKLYDKLSELQKQYLDEMAVFGKEHGFNIFGIDDKTGKAAAEKLKEQLSQLAKVQRDGEIAELQDIAKFKESVAISQDFGLQERIKSEQEASSARIKIIKLTLENEIAANKEALDKIESERQARTKVDLEYQAKVSKDRDEINKKLSDKRLTNDQRDVFQSMLKATTIEYEKAGDDIAEASKVAAQKRENIIEEGERKVRDEVIAASVKLADIRKHFKDVDKAQTAKYYQDLVKQEQEFSDPVDKPGQNQDKLLAASLEMENKAFANTQAVREANYENQKEQVEKQYSEGLLGFHDYQDKLAAIEKDKQKQNAQDLVDSLTKQLDSYKKFGTIGSTEALKVAAALSKAQAAIDNLSDKIPKLGSNASQALKDFQSGLQKVVGYIYEVTDLIGGFVNASVQKQLNALQILEDGQEKNYEQEVANITNSTLAEQFKANTLKDLEAERAAQKEQNERREREASQKNARFEKAATITKIITEGALAVVHQLATGDPFTATIRAAIAGGEAAAQLAVALATPIPSYKTLTENHPGGLFVFGDRPDKKTEVAITPKGEMFAADQPTIMHGDPGLKVRLLETTFPTAAVLPDIPKAEQTDMSRLVNRTLVLLHQSNVMDNHQSKKRDQLLHDQNQKLAQWQVREFVKAMRGIKPTVNITNSSEFEKWKQQATNWHKK